MTDPDVVSTRIDDGVAVVTLGSPARIHFDSEMGDALLEALTRFVSDDAVRVIVVTGGAPGYFVRHYSVAELVKTGERLRSSGTPWPDDRPYKAGAFASAMRLVETVPKPVIAAISGSAMGGGFEFTLACDIRIAQQGDYHIGLPEIMIGIPPGGGGTQRLPRVIGTSAALKHILMGATISPVEAERQGFVHESVAGKALDRALEIARRLASHTPASVAAIKRLVRSAVETPLDQGLQLERNLFMQLCSSDEAISRMVAYAERDITDPSRPLQR